MKQPHAPTIDFSIDIYKGPTQPGLCLSTKKGCCRLCLDLSYEGGPASLCKAKVHPGCVCVTLAYGGPSGRNALGLISW
uniref:Uncharacterized protein n=1 Tax=Picea glauca TaxID=3330 RepID=A0A101LUH7_PICGL|nr:hypothetical protein ABT39_MTgene2433 [Picea glauca]QHR86790.1 hypothetical protein Q903MT_gene795 [Picea sitchensis]